jgi:antitoxin (DNA-binding transcriptional repressor) of toxin-antitoxin stability system
MTSHTAAESDSNLTELLDRVIGGENVVITRDGEAVAELTPIPRNEVLPKQQRPPNEAEGEFLRLLSEIPQHVKDAAVADVRAAWGEEDE